MTTIADVIADGLARAGTSRVVGVASNEHTRLVLDAMRARGLALLETASGRDACIAAAVTGALTGAPGAAVLGGRAEDAVEGLACAFLHRWPLITIGGRASPISGGDDLAAVTKARLPVTAGSASHWIAHACQLAMTEPWGPVHLDLEAAPDAAAVPVATACRPAPLPPPGPAILDGAARRIGAAQRPVVVIGRFCRSEGEAAWVRAFAEARPAPVLVTEAAKGALPDPHPLVISTLDGGEVAAQILASGDLLVAVGVDALEEQGPAWPRGRPTLRVGPVALEPRGDDPDVVGDIALILEELAPRLRDARLGEWDVARLHALKQTAVAPPPGGPELTAFRVVERVRQLTPPQTIAVFEVASWTAKALPAWQAVAPGECLVSAAPPGFAATAAVAAQLAHPDRRVVCFAGAAVLDEPDPLATLARLALPVPLVMLVDRRPAAGSPAGLKRIELASPDRFAAAFETAFAASAPTVIAVPLGDEGAKQEG